MSDLIKSFSALGDATRFAIVERLMDAGPQSAGELGKLAKFSAPAISRHLKILREAGLINQKIDRQSRIYSVRPEAVQAISSWVETHTKMWNAGLDRLEAALDATIDKKET